MGRAISSQMMVKGTLRYFLIALLLFLNGCRFSLKPFLDPPIPTPPKRAETNFTDALRCFGDMTKAYKRPKVYLTSSKVEDATGVARASGGEIPVDATPMLQSSIVGIGGQIHYIANYPVLSSNLFKLYGMPIPKTNEKAPRPTLYLDAAISAYDRAVLKEDVGAGLDGEDGGGAVNKGTTASVITVDMNLVKIPSLEMIPKVQSVNSLELRDTKVDGDFDVKAFGLGFDISLGSKGLAARHKATRALLDLGVIQTLGRYLTLPWWKCSPVHEVRDPVVIESLREYYRTLSPENRVLLIQELLLKRGYQFDRVKGVINSSMIVAIHRLQKENGYRYIHEISEELYVDIALVVPDNLSKPPPAIEF